MRTDKLIDRFIYAQLLQQKDTYNEQNVDALVKKYLQEELVFLPGGVLTFSARLMSARIAFTSLLDIESSLQQRPPLILIEDLHSSTMQSVESLLLASQEAMVNRKRQLGLSNLPDQPLNNNYFWEPLLVQSENQQVQ